MDEALLLNPRLEAWWRKHVRDNPGPRNARLHGLPVYFTELVEEWAIVPAPKFEIIDRRKPLGKRESAS